MASSGVSPFTVNKSCCGISGIDSSPLCSKLAPPGIIMAFRSASMSE